MADSTTSESRQNLQTTFSYGEHLSAPMSLACSAQLCQSLYGTADTDRAPMHCFSASTKSNRAKSSEDLKFARKLTTVRQPHKNGTLPWKPRYDTTSSTMGLSSMRKAWTLEGDTSIPGLFLKLPRRWAQVTSKAVTETTRQSANVKTKCQRKRPTDGLNSINSNSHEQSLCKKQKNSEDVELVHTQKSHEDNIIITVLETLVASPPNESKYTSESDSRNAPKCCHFETRDTPELKRVIVPQNVPQATAGQLEHAITELVKQHDVLEHATRLSKHPRIYYTFDNKRANQVDLLNGPFTLEQVQQAALHEQVPTASVHSSCQSCFIYPFFSLDSMSLSWLSVNHALDRRISDDHVPALMLGKDDNTNITIPWWELKPEETIIGRAMIRRNAEDQHRQRIEQTIEEDYLEHCSSTLSYNHSDCSIRPGTHRSRPLNLFLKEKTTDHVKSTTYETMPLTGIDSPSSTSLPADELSLPINFLKMTQVEKKAFYSSPAMNRIASKSLTPLPIIPSPNLWPLHLLQGADLDDELDQSITSDESTTTVRRHLTSTLTSLQDFCAVGDNFRGMVTALDIRVLSEEDELTFHSDFADYSVREMRARLFQYEEAMKMIPAWLEEVCVEAVVPKWFSRKEVECALQRMKIWVLVRTHGKARWLCEIKGQGLERGLGKRDDAFVSGLKNDVIRWDAFRSPRGK